MVRYSLSRTISQAVIFLKTHVLSPVNLYFSHKVFSIVQMLIKQWFANHQSAAPFFFMLPCCAQIYSEPLSRKCRHRDELQRFKYRWQC